MHKRSHSILTTLACTALLLPLFTSALTADDLIKQIAELTARVRALQAQLQELGAATTPASSDNAQASAARPFSGGVLACPSLLRALTRGARGEDVRSLQRFLSERGLLASDSVTGYFGALTERAVQLLQEESGVLPSGSSAANGYGIVGARTIAAIRARCADVAATLSVSTGSDVGALAARITAEVNTNSSCREGVYRLDFGDGTAQDIGIQPNLCAPVVKEIVHVYPSRGTYAVTITNGTLRTSIQATVSGSVSKGSTCSPPAFDVPSWESPRLGQIYSLPIVSYSEDPSDHMTVQASGIPPGFTLVEKTTRAGTVTTHAWSLDGSGTAAGTYDILLTAENSCGKSSATLTLPIYLDNNSTPSRLVCPVVPAISCIAGYKYVSGGYDQNGCARAGGCIPANVCPAVEYLDPICLAGQHVEKRTSGGCPAPSVCVPNSPQPGVTFSASPVSGKIMMAVGFTVTGVSAGSIGSYSIDFGDGSTKGTAWSTAVLDNMMQFQSHVYAVAGTYTARLQQMKEVGTVGTLALETVASATITVSGTGTNFNATPVSGTAPLDVAFTYSSVSGGYDKYSIDFGDDTGESTIDVCTTSLCTQSMSLAPRHTYTASGVYIAKLLGTKFNTCGTQTSSNLDSVCAAWVSSSDILGTVKISVQ